MKYNSIVSAFTCVNMRDSDKNIFEYSKICINENYPNMFESKWMQLFWTDHDQYSCNVCIFVLLNCKWMLQRERNRIGNSNVLILENID